MRKNRRAWLLLAAIVLSSCSSVNRPAVDPSVQGMAPKEVERHIAECSAILDGSTSVAERTIAASKAAGGAILGAVTGGLLAGNPEGAAVGAAAGGGAVIGGGMLFGESESDRLMVACLNGRGVTVIGQPSMSRMGAKN